MHLPAIASSIFQNLTEVAYCFGDTNRISLVRRSRQKNLRFELILEMNFYWVHIMLKYKRAPIFKSKENDLKKKCLILLCNIISKGIYQNTY
jgi:hypothetical protein